MTAILLALGLVWAACSIGLMVVMLLARRSAAVRRQLFGAPQTNNVRPLRPIAERSPVRLAA